MQALADQGVHWCVNGQTIKSKVHLRCNIHNKVVQNSCNSYICLSQIFYSILPFKNHPHSMIDLGRIIEYKTNIFQIYCICSVADTPA